MSIRISANVIALDEQRNIGRCLQSLTWADEIIVLDGGSSDATVDIARRFSDHVHLHPFDDFASQRNRALSRSSGDWVLSLDCDEWVPANLAAEIRRSIAAAPPRCHGFWVPIRSRIFGRLFRYCGTQNERKLRLFRRDRASWQGNVHETVRLSGAIASLRNAIQHESTPDLDAYLRKLIVYSSFECDRLVRSGRRPGRGESWLAPLWRFGKLYFGKLGFLDGSEGLRFCLLSAWQEWITYQKCWERYRDRTTESHVVAVNSSAIEEAWHGRAFVAA